MAIPRAENDMRRGARARIYTNLATIPVCTCSRARRENSKRFTATLKRHLHRSRKQQVKCVLAGIRGTPPAAAVMKSKSFAKHPINICASRAALAPLCVCASICLRVHLDKLGRAGRYKVVECSRQEQLCSRDDVGGGRTLTLKIACRVRRWRSVKTSRGFLGAGCWCSAWLDISSFLLQAEIDETDMYLFVVSSERLGALRDAGSRWIFHVFRALHFFPRVYYTSGICSIRNQAYLTSKHFLKILFNFLNFFKIYFALFS